MIMVGDGMTDSEARPPAVSSEVACALLFLFGILGVADNALKRHSIEHA